MTPARERSEPGLRSRLSCAALCGLAAVVLATGCARSEQIDYARKMSAVIEPGPAGNHDVAIAFGLDQYAPDYESALAGREGRGSDAVSLTSR